MTDFLDATGVQHEDGMIEDVDGSPPDEAKIPDAVKELDAKHDAQDVSLYLAMCVEMWPEIAGIAKAGSSG